MLSASLNKNISLSLMLWGDLYVSVTREEGILCFTDALNTFYLWLYGIRHMVKDLLDSEKGNLLPPHGLLVPMSSKGSFICTIPPFLKGLLFHL